MSRTRIYLDKCFWIYLRDASIGRSKATDASALLGLLRSGVSEGRFVCPISDILFLELMNQSDPITRLATADLIDELSLGTCLLPNDHRIATEVENLVETLITPNATRLESAVWTKVSYVLGIVHPSPLPIANSEEIQARFFDHLWEFPLRKMLEVIGSGMPPSSMFGEQATRLNDSNDEHSSEMKSFQQVLRDEIGGVMDLLVPQAIRAAKALQSVEAAELREALTDGPRAFETLCRATEFQEGRRALRTSYLGCLFHAAVRWNRTKRLKANDLADFQHAQAGVGYCNALFTDGPTKHMVEQRNLNIRNDFPCEVFASISEAKAWAERAG